MSPTATNLPSVPPPGGRLLLADHVASTSLVVLALQRVLEKLTLRLSADHLTRRPLPLVVEAGFVIERQERYKRGIVERVVARKPTPGDG